MVEDRGETEAHLAAPVPRRRQHLTTAGVAHPEVGGQLRGAARERSHPGWRPQASTSFLTLADLMDLQRATASNTASGPASHPSKSNQAGFGGRPDAKRKGRKRKSTDYAARFRRRMRMVLAPKGSNSNAPASIVVGSGTTETFPENSTRAPVGLPLPCGML
jgi:hypothetical protein